MTVAAASQCRPRAELNKAPPRPFVLFEDGRPGHPFLLFENPLEIIEAHMPEEVSLAFERMQHASDRGLHLAGIAGYELGYALEPRLRRAGAPSAPIPLLRFGVFRAPRELADTTGISAPIELAMTPVWSIDEYQRRFVAAREYILAGDAYQINLTFPLSGRYAGDPVKLYRALRLRQPVTFGGVAALGDETIVSLSPEMFFERRGREIRVRPMKGTAPRGADPAEDAVRSQRLAEDIKNRAENLMIVDLLRNDLSRLSEIGSVKVTDLFTIENYPTLHQMTSGIKSRLRTDVSFAQLFAGLFPCGSVTGVPKIRAMEIIREMESGPRGVYCGSLGVIAPDGAMRFNVAIRTLTLFEDATLVCNVGSAVVADSRGDEEYAECLMKAKFLAGTLS